MIRSVAGEFILGASALLARVGRRLHRIDTALSEPVSIGDREISVIDTAPLLARGIRVGEEVYRVTGTSGRVVTIDPPARTVRATNHEVKFLL